jgi:hypothetical protein
MAQLETKCCQWQNWRPTTLGTKTRRSSFPKEEKWNATHINNFIVTTITFLKVLWNQMKKITLTLLLFP